MIKGFYENKEQLQRDEAIRSSSLVAMTLMFGSVNRGWDTCPMIGFDPEAVSKILKLDEFHIPVMLLTFGYRKEDSRPRSPRRPIAEVVKNGHAQWAGTYGMSQAYTLRNEQSIKNLIFLSKCYNIST
jgi:hypothetical protein